MTVVSNLLLKNRGFSPTYHPAILANHLSMTLIALDKMGASEEQLKKYYENYSHKLEPAPLLSNKIVIDDENWINYLGCDDYYPNYLEFFQKNIQLIGIDNTLTKYLQSLIKGVSGQAFHCLIRLAYAIEIKDSDEIAVSLAYFSCHYLVLGSKKNLLPIFQHPEEVLDKINRTNNLSGEEVDGINITERLKKAAVIPEFTTIIDWLKVGKTTLSESASILITLYAETKDPTVLHMVTATHAMRLIQPYLTNLEDAICYYWQAICAAYITIGAPAITREILPLNKFSQEKINWPAIFKKATHSSDEHVIKFVYTCYEEDRIYQNPLYLYVAANIVYLIDEN